MKLFRHLITTLIYSIICISSIHYVQASPLKQLDSSLKTTDREISAIKADLKTIHGKLETYEHHLNIPHELHHDIKTSRSRLNTITDIIKLAKVIPDLREPIKQLTPTIDSVDNKLKTAENTANKIKKITDPVKEKIILLEKKVHQLHKALDKLKSKGVKPTRKKIQKLDKCLGEYKAEHSNSCEIQPLAFSTANKVKPSVDETNKQLAEIINAVNTVKQQVNKLPKIDTQIADLHNLIDQINQYNHKLNPLYSKLKALKHKFNSKVGFSFKYPNPILPMHPLRMSTKHVRISVYDALKSFDAIEKKIENILSSTLYKVLEGIGIDGYIKDIQKSAKDAVNSLISPIKKLVDDALNASIPGLNSFKPSFNSIQLNVGNIENALPSINFDKYNFDSIKWRTTFSLVSCEATCQGKSVELTAENHGPWGDYAKEPEKCSKGHFVTGYRVRVEAKQGSGDDTAMNSILLKCSNGKEISSKKGFWGKWTKVHSCPKGEKAAAFKLRVEAKQGSGDDSALNAISIRCRKDGEGFTDKKPSITAHKGYWGSWSKHWETCPLETAVCGVRTRVEPKQGKGDDSAMNDIRLLCCPLK